MKRTPMCDGCGREISRAEGFKVEMAVAGSNRFTGRFMPDKKLCDLDLCIGCYQEAGAHERTVQLEAEERFAELFTLPARAERIAA